MDVKVLNKGGQTAVLTDVKVSVTKVWRLIPIMWTRGARLSATEYQDVFRIKSVEGYCSTYKISQVIPSNKADRFTIMMANDQAEEGEIVYQINVELIFGDDKCVVGWPLLFIATNPSSVGMYIASSEVKAAFQEIQDTEGRKSEYLQKLISRILNTP